LRIRLHCLDSLYVLGVSSIIITLISAGSGLTINVHGLVEVILNNILIFINENFDGINISLGKDFWIAERIFYGLLSIWYVDHLRESLGSIDGKNIFKYSSLTRIVIGVGMVFSALALPILGKTSVVPALGIGCFGLFFAYPLIKMLKTEQS